MIEKNIKLEIELDGGIGNQLFMFYAGLFFGQTLEKEVVFNTSKLSRVAKLHPGYNLNTLGMLQGHEIVNQKATGILAHPKAIKIQNAYSRTSPLRNRQKDHYTFKSPNLGFIESSLIPNETTRISGYFQTYKYFCNLQEKPILSTSLINNTSKWYQEKAKENREKKPVGVHIRRGDYLLRKNRKIGVISFSYYRSAIEEVANREPVWIFTDSPNQVSEEFKYLGDGVEVMRPPSSSDPIESLLLLSMSPKIIISNSTFSWWAAQLAQDRTEVYAPNKWFQFASDPVDLMPEFWNKIESKWESGR